MTDLGNTQLVLDSTRTRCIELAIAIRDLFAQLHHAALEALPA